MTFETTVTAMGNDTGIGVPKDVIERLGCAARKGHHRTMPLKA
ncbi:MAG TPA: hypothetical protein VFH56_07510 [Acidimicrobiales bacterium]|nr:hypothetical protein [Acidimicrobiales bacterium]